MASDPKRRTEPEADRPEAGPETGPETGDVSGPSAEDLVPGLSDAVASEEIAAQADEIARLEGERDELKDKLLRALAETENVRRRAERDRKDAETFGGTRLARDLLSVHDNLERAMAAADDEMRAAHPGFIEGLELTRRELLNAFAKHRIETVQPDKGERFDPNLHQAMFEMPTDEVEPGAVVQVMQAGFTIAGRLLRPALVGVAKAAPPAEGRTTGETPPRDNNGAATGA